MFCDSFIIVFFFKQKTAYEMRISDWSSDVCSSDLDVTEQFAECRRILGGARRRGRTRTPRLAAREQQQRHRQAEQAGHDDGDLPRPEMTEERPRPERTGGPEPQTDRPAPLGDALHEEPIGTAPRRERGGKYAETPTAGAN